MAQFTIPSVFTAIDKFSSPVKNMGRNVQNFAQQAQAGVARAERGFRRLTPALSGAAKEFLQFASAAAISSAIVGGIHFTVQSLKDYETALASTQAVTGTTNEEFIAFRKEIDNVAKDTKKSAVDVAKSFEIVGSAKPELLASADALGAVTKASIVLAKASRDDLETSALNLTGVMNQFNLSAEQSERTINVLSAGAKVGSASISNVGESMKNFGSVAAGANMSLEQSVALVEVLGKFSVFGAEAGTKLRGATLKLQQAGVGYASGQFNINDALEEAKKKHDKLATAQQKDAFLLKTFGAENISTGKILLSNIALFEEYTKGVTGTNTANEMAAINSNTLSVALDEAKNAWVNMVTGANGSTSALNTAKDVVRFLTDNLAVIVSIGTKVLLFFAAWKAAIIVSQVALAAYNIVLGITGALSGTAALAIGKSAIAMKAYAVTAKIVTAAQWLWNAAMSANPIGLIIIGVAALIALVAVIINKWNEWGAAVSLFLGPIGFVISLIQSFRRNWDMVTESFKTGGILGALKAIGKVILDAMIMPVQQLLSLIAKIPGMEWAENASKGFGMMRASLGLNTETDESGNQLNEKPLINPEVRRQESLKETIRTSQQSVKIDIADQTGRAKASSDSNAIPINLTPTFGY